MLANMVIYHKIEKEFILWHFRDKEDFDRFQMPMPTTLDKNIKDVLILIQKVDDKYYYTEGKYKGNIYKLLTEEMDDDNTVYQWRRKYVRKTKVI